MLTKHEQYLVPMCTSNASRKTSQVCNNYYLRIGKQELTGKSNGQKEEDNKKNSDQEEDRKKDHMRKEDEAARQNNVKETKEAQEIYELQQQFQQ